ncbi:hypothetical protein HN51_050132, partial [Arachis hypogaea]
ATHVAAAPASVTVTAFDRLKSERNLDKLFHLLNVNAIRKFLLFLVLPLLAFGFNLCLHLKDA